MRIPIQNQSQNCQLSICTIPKIIVFKTIIFDKVTFQVILTAEYKSHNV